MTGNGGTTARVLSLSESSIKAMRMDDIAILLAFVDRRKFGSLLKTQLMDTLISLKLDRETGVVSLDEPHQMSEAQTLALNVSRVRKSMQKASLES